MKTEFDKIYCISFLENQQRRAVMERQFLELGIDVTFYNALNYRKIFNKEVLGEIQKINNQIYSWGVFGCSHSHYSIIKEAQLLGYKKILIFEDDALLIKDKFILEKYFNNLPENWDFIKYFLSLSELCNFCPKHLYDKEWKLFYDFNNSDKFKNQRFINYKELPDWFPGSNCSCCYALNEKGINFVVEEYEKKFLVADQVPYLFKSPNGTPLNQYFTNKIKPLLLVLFV